MSNNKMLIDASHPEETRVVVLRGNRIEEFDFEAANKKPLRGNIYLAKVTRVEPSLQAAFVEYGGNRHGFLAFSEIHPDYYQIPVADRLALLEDEAREQREEADEEEKRSSRRNTNNNRRRRGGRQAARRTSNHDESVSADAPQDENGATDAQVLDAQETGNLESAADLPADHPVEEQAVTSPVHIDLQQPDAGPVAPENAQASTNEAVPAESVQALPSPAENTAPEPSPAGENASSEIIVEASFTNPAVIVESAATVAGTAPAAVEDNVSQSGGTSTEDDGEQPEARAPGLDDAENDDGSEDDEDSESEDDEVEQLGGESEEDISRAPRRSRKQYKIQEVIKRRQIMLIQVVKEERGNKGAALTTYLSLAGRYSVLMPNTARGGGISRKITDGDDRRRMKEIVQDLDVPEGMGVILRTAGASRNNQEIRRDFEYLLRLWESVREMTLHSSAPTLVYEEGSLIKRSIRDLYGKEVDEVIVSGDEGYKEAKDFMRMLMPSHVRNVKQWRESQPVYAKSGVEPQLDSLFSPNVTLKSGGYIVINQTEALVAIDVNSGRSTREHNIEDTALRTNMEAADEVARQLRLRDLAGLIVVDFIDMEEHRNNRSVERRMKDALKNDRARIQVGRISHFGLLEMSRQRMRTGVLEGSSIICPHCQGSGNIRSTASIALHVLRLTEEALLRNNTFDLIVKTRSEVALYILNQKRATLIELEQRFGVALCIDADNSMTGTTYHAIERGEPALAPVSSAQQALQFSSPADEEDGIDTEAEADIDASVADDEAGDEKAPLAGARAGGKRNQRGRSRTRRPERDTDQKDNDQDENTAATENIEASELTSDDAQDATPASAADGDQDEDAAQNRKRRRRRRGRSDRPSSGISAEAPQPSDDGLGYIADANAPIVLPSGSADDAANQETAPSESPDSGDGASEDTTASRRRGRRGGFRERKRLRTTSADDGQASGDAGDTQVAGDGEAVTASNGAWVKSDATGGAKTDSAPQTYPFTSPSMDNQNLAARQQDEPENERISEPANPLPPAQDVSDGSPDNGGVNGTADAGVLAAVSSVSLPEPSAPNGNGPADMAREQAAFDGAATDEPPAAPRAPKDIEALPEAPPPPVKRTGWWKR
jgi:ribonuclease E